MHSLEKFFKLLLVCVLCFQPGQLSSADLLTRQSSPRGELLGQSIFTSSAVNFPVVHVRQTIFNRQGVKAAWNIVRTAFVASLLVASLNSPNVSYGQGIQSLDALNRATLPFPSHEANKPLPSAALQSVIQMYRLRIDDFQKKDLEFNPD